MRSFVMTKIVTMINLMMIISFSPSFQQSSRPGTWNMLTQSATDKLNASSKQMKYLCIPCRSGIHTRNSP